MKLKNKKREYYWFYDLYPQATDWSHTEVGSKEVELHKILAPNRADIDEERIIHIKKLIVRRNIQKLENAAGGISLLRAEYGRSELFRA